jgi:hypothetical protein
VTFIVEVWRTLENDGKWTSQKPESRRFLAWGTNDGLCKVAKRSSVSQRDTDEEVAGIVCDYSAILAIRIQTLIKQ